MELIAKFYPHLWSEEVIEQVALTWALSIKEEIKGFGEAEFSVPISQEIKEDCKLELYEANSNEDRLIFSGFVYEINPIRGQFQLLKITARGQKAIFHKRKALRKHTFTAQPLSSILRQLLTPYNTEFNEDWGFDVQKDESLTLEIEQGDDYADIFDEICEQKELFWSVKEGVVHFKKHGNDLRTTQILEFDALSPNPWNITNIELIGTASGGNVALIEDANGKLTLDKSQFSGLLTWVVSKQIRKGDDEEKAKQFAKEQARPQRKYQIQVANSSIIANLWDRIKVEVVNTNSFYDFKGDAIVQSKTTTYANASKVVVYGIQEFMITPFSAESRVESVEKSIKLLRQRRGGASSTNLDLSGYATSSSVSSALQSQNGKIDKKADADFVQWVAQTANTALNTANQAKQEVAGKADANHHHDDRYYTESEIDQKLNQKANTEHTHTKSQITDFPTAMPASDVYERAKQVNKPSYTISEIQGLQEALNNKASGVASLDRIDLGYTTNLTQRRFKIASRHQLSNVWHAEGGHQLQVLWWDLQPQGTGHDGGWGLMFWPDQNPYLHMQGEDIALGRTGGVINPKTRINFPQSVGIKREANTDGANIYFRSTSNDDSSLDFKLYDDGSEWFRFLYNNTRRTAFNHDLATYKQKFFVHGQVQYGEFPAISLAIWDSDTGFNRESDGVLSYYSNGSKLQTIHQNAVPVVAEDFGRNVKIKKLTQTQYDALGAGRPSNVIYYITD